MRTAKIKLNGNEYLMCFSTRVVRVCTERYGDIDKIGEVLKDAEPLKALDEALWLLSTMLDGGARYAKLNNIENPTAPTFDELYDICDMSDLVGLKEKIQETITGGSKPSVAIESQKNAVATPTV